jgi:hypothetical protein
MKFSFLIGMVFLAAIARPAVPPQAPEPLKKDQVMDLVKAGMDPSALVKLIREHGLDFDLTDDYIQALHTANAPDSVIQALRTVRPQPLSRQKVLTLVAGGVPSGRAAELVKQRGVSFQADEEYLKTLRLAGADEALVAAVRTASAAAAADLEVVTSASADVYLDDQLQGHADAQGKLTVKSALGTHALKVSLPGKKDFQQSVALAAKQTTTIEARLEDMGSAPGAVGAQYPYPAMPAPSPLVTEAATKARECMTMVNIWNSKLQQVMSSASGDYTRYGLMQNQIKEVNQERVATYRSKLMPQLKDLQQKFLAELGRTSDEHLDYEMVKAPLQLIGVCGDLSQLSSQYQMSLLRPKSQ